MEGFSSKQALTFLLILFFINIISVSVARPIREAEASTEFIKTSCSETSYPRLCVSSLSRHASLIQTSPKLMAHAALNVTLATAKSTSMLMTKLSQSTGLKPREVAAMTDCIEELSDSVDELRRSINEMGTISSSNFGLTMSDVQTWVSAALTDENTCTDGFAGKSMNGELKTAVRGQIVNIAHLTSNALALINRYAALHG